MRSLRPLDLTITIHVLVVFAIVICQACDQSSPVYHVGAPPEGTPVTSTEAQVATPTPGSAVPHPTNFEDSLSDEALARYKNLPVEFQDALREEAEISDHEKAMQYLRNLPDDIVPISELLDDWEITIFEERLDSSYQRLLLLEGYPNSTNVWFSDKTEEEARFGEFSRMVMALWHIVSRDGEVLPPLEETLSPEALAKLDTIDPVMLQSFRLIWESTRTLSPAEFTEELEQDLLAAPSNIPSIEELALSAEAIELLDDMPDLKALIQQKVATAILRNHKWDEEDTAGIEQFLAPYYTQEGKAAFTRGLDPSLIHSFPLVCGPLKPRVGIALPTWAIPAPFRDVPWTHMMFKWPSHEQTLSEEALSRLRSMDATIQDTFEKFWYGTGPMPKEAGKMACSAARWERGLIDSPFTSLPAPEEILSTEVLDLYRSFTPSAQDMFRDQMFWNILNQGSIWNPETGEAVPIYGTPLEEILEALNVWGEHFIRSAHKSFSNTK